MSELTREYLDKQLNNQTKELKSYVDGRINVQTEEINSYVDDKVGEVEVLVKSEVSSLARMTADGLEEIKSELNVKKEVESLGRRMFRIEQALHIK